MKQNKNKTANNESSLGLRKGMSGKFLWRKEANMKKGKQHKRKNERNIEQTKEIDNVFSKGADAEKGKRKDAIFKGKATEK